MGFLKNIISAAAEKVLSYTKAPESAREPVKQTIAETVGSAFSRVWSSWRDAARKESRQEPRQESRKEPQQEPRQGFKRSDRAEAAGVPIPSLNHKLKAAGLSLKPTEWTDSKTGKTFYRFTFPDRLKSNDAYKQAMETILKTFKSFNPNAMNMDLMISGHFSKGGFRALSPLLPFRQSATYSLTTGIELSQYKSGMNIDELDSIDFEIVECDLESERGE